MADSYFSILIVATGIISLASLAFGGSDVFTCDDPNDCTSAAIADISDFDFTDLIDILQFFFVFFGDLLELLGFGFLDEVPVLLTAFLQIVLSVGWLGWIISVVV